MNARPRSNALTVVARLHIDCGEYTRPWTPGSGRWLRYPAADYRCLRCGFTDSASGDAVTHFAAHIQDQHKPNCPQTSST